jgi:DNA-binding transcriptional LysR family regulator
VELTPLRYFRAIAEAGHMTRAAEALGVTQPALSVAMRKLEAEVGADLLHRTGRGVELTEAGAALLAHAEEAMRRLDAGVEQVRELAGLHRGSIRVGGGATATTYLLPEVVGELRRRRPGLRLVIREAGSSAVAAAVIAGELDLGIVTLPVAPHGRLVGAGDLMTIPLASDELRLITPPGHPLSGRKSFRWADRAEAPVIGFEPERAVRDLIDAAAARAEATLLYVMELRSIESIKRMVGAGIGVGFVSRFALAEGEGLSCRDERLTRQLAIVRRGDRAPSPAAAEFERALVGRVRKGGR